jgi:hypothetical protein
MHLSRRRESRAKENRPFKQYELCTTDWAIKNRQRKRAVKKREDRRGVEEKTTTQTQI